VILSNFLLNNENTDIEKKAQNMTILLWAGGPHGFKKLD